jgi:hypothetical protein
MPKPVRYCPSCDKEKPHGQFYLRNGRPGGYCKSCTKAKSLERKHQKRDNVVGIEEAQRLRNRHAHFKEMSKRESKLRGKRFCRCCEDEKPLSDFYFVSGRPDSYCKSCRLEIDKKLNSRSPAGRMKTLLSAARARSRKNGWDFNLTKDHLLALWRAQGGKCGYTGIALTYVGDRSHSALSIDRVDSSRGYTIDNVVLCCRCVNEMKSNLTVDKFIDLCRRVVTLFEQKEIKGG